MLADVTIQVADGTYNMGSTLNIRHKNSNNIYLLGNSTTAASCVLNFTTANNGISVELGNCINIGGFKIIGPNTTSDVFGLFINNGAICKTFSTYPIHLNNWKYACIAYNGALCNFGNGITVTGCENLLNTDRGGKFIAPGSSFTGKSKTTSFGISVYHNSYVNITSSTINDCLYPIFTTGGSYCNCTSVTLNNNTNTVTLAYNTAGNGNSINDSTY